MVSILKYQKVQRNAIFILGQASGIHVMRSARQNRCSQFIFLAGK
jgi:hypothetical protein